MYNVSRHIDSNITTSPSPDHYDRADWLYFRHDSSDIMTCDRKGNQNQYPTKWYTCTWIFLSFDTDMLILLLLYSSTSSTQKSKCACPMQLKKHNIIMFSEKVTHMFQKPSGSCCYAARLWVLSCKWWFLRSYSTILSWQCSNASNSRSFILEKTNLMSTVNESYWIVRKPLETKILSRNREINIKGPTLPCVCDREWQIISNIFPPQQLSQQSAYQL